MQVRQIANSGLGLSQQRRRQDGQCRVLGARNPQLPGEGLAPLN